MQNTSKYPIVFDFKETIIGEGFLAGVKVHGRAMAEHEPEGWWIYGVTPVGAAESGQDLTCAIAAFRSRIRLVLVDFAAEASSFEEFRTRATAFLAETDDEYAAEWDAARQEVRAGRIVLGDLPYDRSPWQTRVEVVLLTLHAKANVTEDRPSLLAS